MIKILIVDDDKTATRYMAGYFGEKLGHNVLVVNNPLEALPIIEKEAPHVVLLDILMPQMNGLELLKQIKTKYGSTVKVIMVTVAGNDDRTQARVLGADEVIHKPFDQEYLRDVVMEKIEDVLGLRRKDKIPPDKIPLVLLADDESDTVTRLEHFLNRIIECKLDTAKDGQDAFALISRNDYDLVFLDIKMPRMSGLEIMKKISKAKPFPETIVVTGYLDAEVAEQIKECGADYIIKPVQSFEAFRNKIKQVLEKKGKYWEKG